MSEVLGEISGALSRRQWVLVGVVAVAAVLLGLLVVLIVTVAG